jgi:hypothetical protein
MGSGTGLPHQVEKDERLAYSTRNCCRDCSDNARAAWDGFGPQYQDLHHSCCDMRLFTPATHLRTGLPNRTPNWLPYVLNRHARARID